MRIFIEPAEPLLFRTGRPFTAGENTFAESIFPPTPETLQGALRATIAVHWGQMQNPPISNMSSIFEQDELNRLIGKRTSERDTYGQLRITGLTLGRRSSDSHTIERLFPAPCHIINATLKDASNKKIKQMVFLNPQKVEAGATNIPGPEYELPFPMLRGQEIAGKSEPVQGWLTPGGLRSVLQGDPLQKRSEHLLRPEAIYTHESRLGIGMHDNKKTTKEGYLYQTQMIRMQPDCGFVIDIALGERPYGDREMPPTQEQRRDADRDLAFLSTGWLTLGGEQRAAHFTVLAPQECGEEEGITQTKPGNLLYFATPTYFKKGWLPEDSTLLPTKPLTAAITRYQPIGGWYLDVRNAGGGNKLMRRCVPAGSIYFFDQKVTVNRPLTEYGWQIGYGIAYTGEWKR